MDRRKRKLPLFLEQSALEVEKEEEEEEGELMEREGRQPTEQRQFFSLAEFPNSTPLREPQMNEEESYSK